jgi:aspartyl/asparaginyl beta-hydroxylase (cupin superfamily)
VALAPWFLRWLKETARPGLNRLLARYSLVGDPVVFEPSMFDWTKLLEENWEPIRDEAQRLLEIRDALQGFHEVSPYQSRISKGDSWKTVWLYGFGHRSDIVSELCPVTARIVASVPELQSAFFSMLSPGTHIPPHSGVYKGLINVHLALLVPREHERCRMRVADQTLTWQPGKTLVFDDTNEHEVWNDTDEERVVLFLQFHRPFRSPGRELSQLFLRALRLTAYVRVPLRNVETFDRDFRTFATTRGLIPERVRPDAPRDPTAEALRR